MKSYTRERRQACTRERRGKEHAAQRRAQERVWRYDSAAARWRGASAARAQRAACAAVRSSSQALARPLDTSAADTFSAAILPTSSLAPHFADTLLPRYIEARAAPRAGAAFTITAISTSRRAIDVLAQTAP